MSHEAYQRIVVGYHGCDAAVAERVLAGKAQLNSSTNAFISFGEGSRGPCHFPKYPLSNRASQQVLERVHQRAGSILTAEPRGRGWAK